MENYRLMNLTSVPWEDPGADSHRSNVKTEYGYKMGNLGVKGENMGLKNGNLGLRNVQVKEVVQTTIKALQRANHVWPVSWPSVMEWLQLTRKGQFMLSISHLDFPQVYDMIPQDILIFKLQKYTFEWLTI